MAGRRLSSNDVSVVVALAIVVLVLLLIYVVERDPARAGDSGAGARDGVRAGEVLAPSPLAGSSENPSRTSVEGRVCGAEETEREPGLSDEAVAARQRDEAVQAILSALEARPEPRARAAALYFRAARDRDDSAVCSKGPPACGPGDPRRGGDRDSAAALARLAVESADPQIYAWAYRTCAASARDLASSCQLVNALQWARLDPTNAEPWFAVAGEARARKDGAALDDAMFHVATATVHDSGWGRAAALMVQAAPNDDRLAVGTALASQDAIRYETLDLSMPETGRYCDARALANANRRDTCDKIATMLVERSTTLIGRAVGVHVAGKLDWTPERLAAWEDERDAGYAVERREAAAGTERSLDCGTVRRDLARWVEIARVGEVEALRRRIEASGSTVAALAAEGREAARLDGEAVRAAAVAASAGAAAEPTVSLAAPPR